MIGVYRLLMGRWLWAYVAAMLVGAIVGSIALYVNWKATVISGMLLYVWALLLWKIYCKSFLDEWLYRADHYLPLYLGPKTLVSTAAFYTITMLGHVAIIAST